MITKYLLILGIGHLLGDFYFQNEKIAEYKDKTYKGVVLHSFEYYFAVLLTTLPILSLDMIFAAVYAALAHFVIDSTKYIVLAKKKMKKNMSVFAVDQGAHVISIAMLAYIMNRWNFSIGHLEIINDILNTYGCDAEMLARWMMAILLIHIPTNILIQNLLKEYKPKNDGAIIKIDNKAGRRIGTVERLIMLIFMSIEQYAAIGFVLTAKSIARYDKITKNENFAEYYLLGTLISTLCVIICRMLILV